MIDEYRHERETAPKINSVALTYHLLLLFDAMFDMVYRKVDTANMQYDVRQMRTMSKLGQLNNLQSVAQRSSQLGSTELRMQQLLWT
jgi:hypothetical protein